MKVVVISNCTYFRPVKGITFLSDDGYIEIALKQEGVKYRTSFGKVYSEYDAEVAERPLILKDIYPLSIDVLDTCYTLDRDMFKDTKMSSMERIDIYYKEEKPDIYFIKKEELHQMIINYIDEEDFYEFER